MLRLIVLAILAFAAVAAASYFALPYLLPALFVAQNQFELSKELELLKVLSGVVAAAITALLAAGNSMLMIGRQLRASKDLETHKGQILAELEAKKSALAKELENEKSGHTRNLKDHKSGLAASLEQRKNELAGQLDMQRQRLGHELGLQRLDIESMLSRITSLNSAVASYRHAISALRRGEFDAEEAAETAKELDLSMSFFPPGTELYRALNSFRQRGVYLVERAERIETTNGQRNLWREPSRAELDAGAPLGPRFAADAERVLVLLNAEREQILKG